MLTPISLLASAWPLVAVFVSPAYSNDVVGGVGRVGAPGPGVWAGNVQLKNLAKYGRKDGGIDTVQSDGNATRAALAVDMILESCSMIQATQTHIPKWLLTLGDAYFIRHVVIYRNKKEHDEAFKDIQVILGNGEDFNDCGIYKGQAPVQTTIVCSKSTQGFRYRKVRVQSKTSRALQLCEVQVMGALTHTCYGDSPCQNGGTCKPAYNGERTSDYFCDCGHGYHDLLCACAKNICEHNGTCFPAPDLEKGYGCVCLAGTRGYNCEEADDPCESAPCFNGGTCKNLYSTYRCDCPKHTTGPDCRECLLGYNGEGCIMDACACSPCQHQATCVTLSSASNNATYMCYCGPGYKGRHCSEPCQHGMFGPKCTAECHCFKDADCDIGSGKCPNGCAEGFTGLTCSSEREEFKALNKLFARNTILYGIVTALATIALIIFAVMGIVFVKRRFNKEETEGEYIGLSVTETEEEVCDGASGM